MREVSCFYEKRRGSIKHYEKKWKLNRKEFVEKSGSGGDVCGADAACRYSDC